MKTTTLPYWGQIIGLVSRQPDTDNTTKKPTKSVALSVAQGRSLFITRKPIGAYESTATLYRLDNTGEQVSLAAAPLPCAMEAIATVTDDVIMLLGCDGHLYQTDWQGEKIHKISDMSLFTSIIESHNITETETADTDINVEGFAKS